MAALRAGPSGGRGGRVPGAAGSRTPQSAASAPPSRSRHPGRWVWAPARRQGRISGSAQAPVSRAALPPPDAASVRWGRPGTAPGLAGGGPGRGGPCRPGSKSQPCPRWPLAGWQWLWGRRGVASGVDFSQLSIPPSERFSIFPETFGSPVAPESGPIAAARVASPMAGLRRGAQGAGPRRPFCCVTRRGRSLGGSFPAGPRCLKGGSPR